MLGQNEDRHGFIYIHTYIYIISIRINTIFFSLRCLEKLPNSNVDTFVAGHLQTGLSIRLGEGGWLVDSWPSLCYTTIDRIKGIFQFPELKEYILVVCVRVCQSVTQKYVIAPFIWAGALGPGPTCSGFLSCTLALKGHPLFLEPESDFEPWWRWWQRCCLLSAPVGQPVSFAFKNSTLGPLNPDHALQGRSPSLRPPLYKGALLPLRLSVGAL